jgi:hypothetical protein
MTVTVVPIFTTIAAFRKDGWKQKKRGAADEPVALRTV